MDAVKNPISILFGAVTLIGAVWYPPLMFVGAVGLLATIAYLSIKQSIKDRLASDLTLAGRRLINPLITVRDELEHVVQSGRHRAEFASIGKEALREADSIIRLASNRVEAYEGFSRTLKDQKSAEFRVAQLEEKLSGEMSDETRQALMDSISARRGVLDRYDEIRADMERIEITVNSAVDALLDVKNRLLISGDSSGVEGLDETDLPGMVDRLKTLSTTIEEAEKMIGDRLR